jgi:hypothetical protein
LERIRTLELGNEADEAGDASEINGISRVMPYSVPAGYFEGLTNDVLARIRANANGEVNAVGEAKAELQNLSPLLSSISREMPYSVPAGFFEDIAEKASKWAGSSAQTAKEELDELSPLLSGMKKEMPFSVPQGYFDEINKKADVESRRGARLVSITAGRWFRYAAAAVVTGVIVLSGFLIFGNKQSIDPNEQSFAWVKKNLKKVSTDDIDHFVEMVDAGAPVVASAEVKSDSKETNEIKELIKNIPDEELQQFLDDTEPVAPDDNAEDLFVN